MFLPWVIFLASIWNVQGDPKSNDPDTRVVGGKDAPDGSRPYQISLRTNDVVNNRAEHICGGSILKEQWVLSAAHCTYGYKPHMLIIIAGTNKLSDYGDRYKIDKIINHDYDYRTGEKDICLIKTENKFKFSNKIAAIQLPKSDTKPGTSCVVSGWGFTDQDGSVLPDKLQMVTLKSISTDDCKKGYSDIVKRSSLVISDNYLCTFTKKGEGICQGDSGGPLTANNEVIGVVARNVPCAKGYPDLFTRVYKYLDWIKQNMK